MSPDHQHPQHQHTLQLVTGQGSPPSNPREHRRALLWRERMKLEFQVQGLFVRAAVLVQASGTRPVEQGRLACRSKPHLDQSQPPVFFFGRGLTGLRSERMHRHVRVLHQPGPLRSSINQVDEVKPVFCSYETAQER